MFEKLQLNRGLQQSACSLPNGRIHRQPKALAHKLQLGHLISIDRCQTGGQRDQRSQQASNMEGKS